MSRPGGASVDIPEDLTEQMIRYVFRTKAKGWRLEGEYVDGEGPESGAWYTVYSPDHVARGRSRTSIGAICMAMDSLWCTIAGALT